MGDGAAAGTRAASKSPRVLGGCAWGACRSLYSCDPSVLERYRGARVQQRCSAGRILCPQLHYAYMSLVLKKLYADKVPLGPE
jgi:hypothetical protein